MTAAGPRRTASPLDQATDVFRVRQYLDVLVRGRDLLAGVRRDIGFVDDVRRAMLPATARRKQPTGSPSSAHGPATSRRCPAASAS